MTTCRPACLFLLLLAAVFVLPAQAQTPQLVKGEDFIEVPAIGEGLCVSNAFQSNMVLQRDKPISIWGWAEPGEKVTLTFAGNTASATADKDRAWQVELPAVEVNATPQTLTIKGKATTLTPDNILVGDHAEVAMACFTRMNKKRRRSCAGQGCCNFSAYMA